jgi:hypothetical protein
MVKSAVTTEGFSKSFGLKSDSCHWFKIFLNKSLGRFAPFAFEHKTLVFGVGIQWAASVTDIPEPKTPIILVL